MNIPALQQPPVVASDIAPERLAKNPQLTEKQKIGEASRQFESILLKQILESSQKTVIKSKFSDDSTSSSIYHDMVTTRMADTISKSGSFGLAKTFQQQLNRGPHGAEITDETKSPAPSSASPEAAVHPELTHLKPLHEELHPTSRALKPLRPSNPSHPLKPLHERTLTKSH